MSKFQENVNYGVLLQNLQTGKLQQVPMEHTALLGSSPHLLCSLGVSAGGSLPLTLCLLPTVGKPQIHCSKQITTPYNAVF